MRRSSTTFCVPGAAGGKPQTATKAKLLWDREYLYFFAEMEDARSVTPTSRSTTARLWYNDVFELFFKPADDKPGYYEFEVNAAGAMMEMFLPARDAGGYRRFKVTTIEFTSTPRSTSTARSTTGRTRTRAGRSRAAFRWTDFVATGGRPKSDEVWKFALCRCDYPSSFEGPDLIEHRAAVEAELSRLTRIMPPLKFVGPEPAKSACSRASTSSSLWTTSRVVGSPDPPLPYRVTRAFPKLKVVQPLVSRSRSPARTHLSSLQHFGRRPGPGELIRFKDDPSVDSSKRSASRPASSTT